jgi:hypothetical protein
MPRSRDEWIEILVAGVIVAVLLYAFVIQPAAAWVSQNLVVGGIGFFLSAR